MVLLLQGIAWLVALVWLSRSFAAFVGLPTVTNLLQPQAYPTDPDAAITVVVPARNEGPHIRACLESLLAQDYAKLQVIAVDDRSEDETGALMEELAATHPQRLRVLHVAELPPEWLGKTHAMAMAAEQSASEFLLFTDADVIFAPDAIRLAVAYAVAEQADHVVLVPTTIIRRWDEAALLSFFSTFGLWGARPWKIADPQAKRDALGIGAFNLIRRTAYEQVGGYAALRMEIVEDLGLGRRIKRAGLRQRVVFGKGLVSVHWASGVPGLIGVLTKNIFAAVNFRVPLLLGGCVWLVVFCMLPFVGFLMPGLTTPCTITLASIGWAYLLMGKTSGLSPWNALLTPLAAGVFVFTLLRSMVTTLVQGGVVWRGTFYPLAELRRHRSPLL